MIYIRGINPTGNSKDSRQDCNSLNPRVAPYFIYRDFDRCRAHLSQTLPIITAYSGVPKLANNRIKAATSFPFLNNEIVWK